MNKKIILSGLVPLVLAGGFLGFNIFKSTGNPEIMYKTETVTRGDVQEVITTTGTLNPVSVVDIGSQVSGRIDAVYVDFNTQVRAGRILAQLDPASFLSKIEQNTANLSGVRASLDKARINLDSAEKNRARNRDLSDKDLISYEQMETAEARYFTALSDLRSAEAKLEQAKSLLESSRVDLAFTVLRSPIDGIVINKNVNVGQTVAASLQSPVLFRIAEDLTAMKVECSVDEADIGKVKSGQAAVFSVDAYPEQIFQGTVSQVRYAPAIVQNVVTYTTLVDVANPRLTLLPGMTATVSIIIAEAESALLVPNAALRFTPQTGPGTASQKKITVSGTGNENIAHRPGNQNTSQIWILDETGIPSPVRITTGVTDGTRTAAAGASLKEGTVVITGSVADSSSGNPSGSDPFRDMTRLLG